MKTNITLFKLIVAALFITITNTTFANNVVFKVDIGVFEEEINDAKLSGFSYVIIELADKRKNYKVGEFTDYGKAKNARLNLINRGFENSEVEAYLNNNEITLTKAFNLMDKKLTEKDVFENTDEEVNIEELNYLLAKKKEENKVTFKVQIGLYSSEKKKELFNISTSISQSKTKDGKYQYTTGEFTNLESAKTTKELVRSQGVKDAFIVAYKNGKRIPIADVVK